MRSLREQSGNEYTSKALFSESLLAKVSNYIKNSKHIDSQNSQVLVNMARMCESEAKRKEQLMSVNSSLTISNTRNVNNM